jgi:hypothetical protein
MAIAVSSLTIASERPGRVDAGPRWHRLFHLLCILATPPIEWSLNHNLFVTPAIGWLDPWIYTGYQLSFPTHLQMFGETYYATRLAWLLPGFAVHQVFPPLVANYVLHLSFFYILLFAVYHLVSTSINRHAGLIAAMIFGWNPTIVGALSWDYVDGTGIVFIVLSLLCIEKLSREIEPRWLWALAAGAAMAAMISSNLFLVMLWPVLALFLTLRLGVVRWRSVATALVMVGVGAAAMLGTLALVNAGLGGPWLFLGASFRMSRSMLIVPNIWRATSWSWMLQAAWLVLPVAALIGALATWVRPRWTGTPFATAIRVAVVVSFAIWLIWEARGLPMLFIPYYASYLFPFSLLALLVLGPPISAQAEARTVVLLEIGMVGLFVLAHWLVLSDVNAFWGRAWQLIPVTSSPGRLTTGVTLVACLLSIATWRFVRTESRQRMVFAALLAISFFAVPAYWPSAHALSGSRQYELIASAHRFTRDTIGTNRPKFWYYANALTNRPFIAIASTYLWGYVVINEEFPRLTDAEARDLSGGAPLVLLLPSAEEAERARRALDPYGLDFTVQNQKTFGTGDSSFVVVIANLVLKDTEAGQRRAWSFHEWQGQGGAVVQHDAADDERARAKIVLPPNSFAWTAAVGARGTPSGPYVVSLTAQGEGTLTLRLTGLERPWPLYGECPVELTPATRSIECLFSKPADPFGVELLLVNGPKARSVVSVSGVTGHRP